MLGIDLDNGSFCYTSYIAIVAFLEDVYFVVEYVAA